MHTPCCGVVWGSESGLVGVSHRPLPTKTSRMFIQLTGRSWFFSRVFFQVFFINFVYVLFLSIFVAAILSHVSLSFIFLSHLALISSSEWTSSWIILSHRRTHIRWADSEMSICRRRVFPFWTVLVRGFLSFCSWGLFLFTMFRHPIPSIIPILMSGHGVSWCGHAFLARFQMIRFGLASHRVSMWFIDSVELHVGQNSLCS